MKPLIDPEFFRFFDEHPMIENVVIVVVILLTAIGLLTS